MVERGRGAWYRWSGGASREAARTARATCRSGCGKQIGLCGKQIGLVQPWAARLGCERGCADVSPEAPVLSWRRAGWAARAASLASRAAILMSRSGSVSSRSCWLRAPAAPCGCPWRRGWGERGEARAEVASEARRPCCREETELRQHVQCDVTEESAATVNIMGKEKRSKDKNTVLAAEADGVDVADRRLKRARACRHADFEKRARRDGVSRRFEKTKRGEWHVVELREEGGVLRWPTWYQRGAPA